MALLSDEEVGIGLQGDNEVGMQSRKLQSDADVGLAPKPPEGVAPQLAANVAALSAQRSNPPFKVMQEQTENVLNAFGQGFREGWGPERLGIPPEDVRKLSKTGLFAPEGQSGYNNPFHAFNELLAQTIYTSAEVLLRGGSGAFRGAQQAAVEAGAPRDIAAMPEAFFGSPHPTGMPGAHVAETARRRTLGDVGNIPREPMVADTPFLPLPRAEGLPEIPPPAEGFVRFYHGGSEPTSGGGRWVSQDPAYARGYAEHNSGNASEVHYVDISERWLEEHNINKSFDDTGVDQRAPYVHFEVPEEIAKDFKPFDEAVSVPQARDLGVIGPERPSINEGTPEAAAEAVTRTAADESLPKTESPPIADGGWQARFDNFVDKIQAPGDVKRLIRDSASENDNFPAARQGDIPLQHVESIAEAAGVEPSEVNAAGLGRTLRNDQQVRIAMRLMIQGTDNVKAIAKDVIADASPQNLIKFQEALLRRDMAVEQIVGLRAEWGRTGNVFQEFMRDVKDEKALDSFLKDKCPL